VVTRPRIEQYNRGQSLDLVMIMGGLISYLDGKGFSCLIYCFTSLFITVLSCFVVRISLWFIPYSIIQYS
jgi:hypothetical protein